jgi:hypothetical protein
MLRILIGLVLPFVGVIGLIPFTNGVTWTLWNIPFLYLWIFAWFILTSVCLAICWLCFDRHRPETA